MTSAEIRSQFLKYFEAQGHRVVPSHSLLPEGDATLLFVNAGMVPFKDVFTGQRDSGYPRATTTQKCLRVSGKHNDLEQVGRTPRHHTFFEMLGNFSFGDYFKRDAIRFGWDLLTRVYGLKVEDLWVTVHPDDAEAKKYWLEDQGVRPDRIVEDPSNFWSMGDTGPCGPCSEIHIDRGDTFRGTSLAQDPGDRFMELWNLVFMQYDRQPDGTLVPLPKPSIDTGMGLERICSVLQGVRSNYETDLFMPLILRTAEVAGVPFGADEDTSTALRVIADHARATTFLIADGVHPSNEGRGYVLRRLMRRALRFGYKLGLRGPFFTGICGEVVTQMGGAFPELPQHAATLARIAGQEEDRFLRTLASGMDLLDHAIQAAKGAGAARLDGPTVFKLYDTYGFPPDLTEMIAAEAGLEIDAPGFQAEMQAQRERGRASWKGADDSLQAVLQAAQEAGLRGTFVGYEAGRATSPITGLFVDGVAVERVEAGETAVLATAATPFYGESGGQVGDTGTIRTAGGLARVVDTKRPREDLVLHFVQVETGMLSVGDAADLEVAEDGARNLTRKNHSATHLLHLALREVLGGHVRQRGSLVAPDRLRFDYSHSGPMTDDEIARVEDIVARWVLADVPVTTDVLPMDEAVSRGALHFFGDKYGDVVRMVSMGDSRELCGGTHVRRTGEIGLVKVVAETGVAAGVRRLEALTGPGVLAWMRERDRIVADLSRLLRADPAALAERVAKMQADEKALRKELADAKVKAASGGAGGAGGGIREVKGLKVLVAPADDVEVKGLRDLADVLRNQVGSGLVLLTKADAGKLAVVLAATKDVADRAPANVLLGKVLAGLGGRGGGNPTLAQGAVPEGAATPEQVLQALADAL